MDPAEDEISSSAGPSLSRLDHRDGDDDDDDGIDEESTAACGSSQPLLGHENSQAPSFGRTSGQHSMAEDRLTVKGRLRAYWLGAVVCIGGFLCEQQWPCHLRPRPRLTSAI